MNSSPFQTRLKILICTIAACVVLASCGKFLAKVEQAQLVTPLAQPGYPEPMAYPVNRWNKLRLAQFMDEARRFAANHKVPMFIGESSCARSAPDGSCPRYLADAVSLFEAERWGWAYHCWRCYQGWDPEVRGDVPREHRTGRLPEQRRADSPTILLLKKAMERNRTTGTRN